ncbi:uncharacterized protein N7482_005833 [Penicillium canariense]|uniref:Xylanolytic transcriptional activator regulatory domain-containing protein n=1 Tax=Penicillium canariense TaxID=189055 RepID=A0A9W9LMX3_9EURO|nr:uncharacterized protein N7482_005833 [Penicillium canariense]KAJ5167052.1 hypothetical protein N7482_005833 [Penicillium canariense]
MLPDFSPIRAVATFGGPLTPGPVLMIRIPPSLNDQDSGETHNGIALLSLESSIPIELKFGKIRCSGGHPCQACGTSRIKCTYLRAQQTRGPQRLRSKTKYLIDQAQHELGAQSPQGLIHSSESPRTDITTKIPLAGRSSDGQSERCRIPTNILAGALYIYHVRLYPVWPIVKVEDVVSRLQQDTEGDDLETYALATAVAAAAIAQLRLEEHLLPDKSITAETFAAESIKVRRSCGYRSAVNLNNVRTSFFLHVYYESQQSGRGESLLYLREAISLAQMMHLHREASYLGLPSGEQQIRRRVLWLLFITERGVCILHKLPVVLRTNISTPALDVDDEPQVLPAFLKLLTLFRLFEQSKMFDFIEDDSLGVCPIQGDVRNLDSRSLDMLHDQLQEGSALMDHISDVQKADLCVTRHWMRIILWKVSAKNHESFPYRWRLSPSLPIMVAKDLLNIVSQLPRTAIEAHGLGIELKLYEIANSLADAVLDLSRLPRAPVWDGESLPRNILARLFSLLTTFRSSGKKEVVELLYEKVAQSEYRAGPTMPATIKAQYRPMNSSHLIGATAPEEELVEQASPLIRPDLIRTMSDWHGSQDLHASMPLIGPNLATQGNIHSVEMQVEHHICLDDMLAGGFVESCFSPANNDYFASGYYSHFTESIEPPLGLDDTMNDPSRYSSLPPSVPSYSVQKLIGNFVLQNAGGPSLSDIFFNEDMTKQSCSSESFNV